MLFSIVEIVKRRKNNFVFTVSYILLTVMAVFRYGQLTDYPNYEFLYEHPDQVMQDPLFSLIEIWCTEIGLDFIGFNIVIELTIMLLAYPFFKNKCSKSVFSLLVFYCYAFLILPMSAIRQGICLAFLLFSYDLLVKKRYLWFYVISFVGVFFHVSMLIVFILGITYSKRFYNSNLMLWVVCGFAIVALITPDLSGYIPSSLSSRTMGEAGDSKLMQMLLRSILLIPILYFKPPYGTDGYFAKGIYIVGFCLYCLFSFAPSLASRMEYYFRVFWCLSGAYAIFSMKKTYVRNLFLILVVLVHSVLFFKNINSFIVQGEYNESVTALNFPYVSIFNQDELDDYKN